MIYNWFSTPKVVDLLDLEFGHNLRQKKNFRPGFGSPSWFLNLMSFESGFDFENVYLEALMGNFMG